MNNNNRDHNSRNKNYRPGNSNIPNNRSNINRNPNPNGRPPQNRPVQNIQNSYNARTTYTVPYRYERHKKRTNWAKYGFRILMFLLFFAVIGGIAALIFWLSLPNVSSPQDILYTIKSTEITDNKKKDVSDEVPVSYDIGFANGQYYFPINEIAEKMDFVLAGDKYEYSFVRSKSGEYIRFTTDSTTAYVNDETYYLTVPPFTNGNDIYVPLEFLQNIFTNLTITYDEKNKNKITVEIGEIESLCLAIRKTQKPAAANESDAPYFDAGSENSTGPIETTESATPTEPPTAESTNPAEPPVNSSGFKADLSAYEQYFEPPADKSDEYLVLMNHTRPLVPIDYKAPDLTDLVDTRDDGRATQQLRFYAAMALEAFLKEARANSQNNITVTSAYRSYAYQSQLFNDEVNRLRPTYGDDAEAIAATSIMYPGHSEHQSGLGVDMHTLGSAAQSFGDTAQGKWLAANAHRFGFILRYPADKVDITGVKYEPWHFRYVGKYHATRIYELGLCLEEYWEQYLS